MYWVSRDVRIVDHAARPNTWRGGTCYVSGRVSRDGEGRLLNADFGALFVSDDGRNLYCCDFDLATIRDQIKDDYSVVLEKQVILISTKIKLKQYILLMAVQIILQELLIY